MAQWLTPVAAGVVVAPLFKPVFLHFIGRPDPDAAGIFGVVIRLALVVISLFAIDTYGALIRSESRHVLAILPVDPGEVAIEELADVARARSWVPLVAAILLLPIGLDGQWLAWAGAVGVMLGAGATGIAVSGAVHLLAISAAEDPRFAGLLDLVRGSNPREQAAFLWAPGLALALAGVPVVLATEGVRRMALGQPSAAVALLLPLVAAGIAMWRVPGLARRGWFRASAVLADIDARYALVEASEEATAAYLDWMPRFLPTDVARYALKDLRHGWRARRTWISGMWGVGVLAAMASWSADPDAPGRGLAIGILGVWLTASVGVLLERDEPAFLRVWFPPDRVKRGLARSVVLASWLQPAVLVPVVAVSVRHGFAAGGQALALGELAVCGAVVTAVACTRLKDRGVLVYGPVAAVAGSALAVLATGGGL
ncbi:MAG: hypothetical protein KC912_14590 [Proteobacteria bacterium]|nr:hypothetical protein [Pseudomonadota bacterium]